MDENILELLKSTMSVPEMRRLLGLGKTDSYWLVKKQCFETVSVCGRIRILRESFDEWYKSQVRYSRIDGKPPGCKLVESSYSIRDIMCILKVSDSTVYEKLGAHGWKTFKSHGVTRVTKQSFDEWYINQYGFPPRMASPLEVDSVMKLAAKRERDHYIRKGSTHSNLTHKAPDDSDSGDRINEPSAQKAQTSKDYYTLDETAKALDINKKRLYRMIEQKMINAVKQRGCYMIPQEEYVRIGKGGK